MILAQQVLKHDQIKPHARAVCCVELTEEEVVHGCDGGSDIVMDGLGGVSSPMSPGVTYDDKSSSSEKGDARSALSCAENEGISSER